jgi:hypothetical protein
VKKKTENKDVKVRNEKQLTKTKAKMAAKVNEVKAVEKTLIGFRMRIEEQLDKKIGSKSTITLPPPWATTFNISVLIYIHIIFTIFISKNCIPISNLIVSDPLDHPFQPFTVGDLSDCKMLCSSQQTASVQAENLVKVLANSDSI